MRRAILSSLILFAAFADAGSAATVALAPSRDNTLVESLTGALSNGAGPHCFVGRTNQPVGVAIRRALVAFDLTAIPSGSVITSVELQLHISLIPPGGPLPPRLVRLHRVIANWGEGTSNSGTPGGAGAPATPGDATWIHRFNPDSMWTVPGGDFLAAPSASQAVGDTGFYTWTSTPVLVSDVQSWLNAPATNFGWLLSSEEGVPGTARRFDSRENLVAARRPVSRVEYDPGPTEVRASTWGRLKALFHGE